MEPSPLFSFPAARLLNLGEAASGWAVPPASVLASAGHEEGSARATGTRREPGPAWVAPFEEEEWDAALLPETADTVRGPGRVLSLNGGPASVVLRTRVMILCDFGRRLQLAAQLSTAWASCPPVSTCPRDQ